MPQTSLTVQICCPTEGVEPEQAPPVVDEMAKKHGPCPYTGARRSGAGPRGSILRFPSSPAANVNDPNVNWVPQGNLMSNVQGAMIFPYGSWALPLSWCTTVDISSSDTCDEDQEKRDDVRSISKRNTTILDWFRPSRGVIVLHQVCVVLCFEIRCPW
jgi:hypothetical protein